MKDMRNQYYQVYDADNSRYSYREDDGTLRTYLAGEDGITEEWIALLKQAHRDERNLMRRGSVSSRKTKHYSIEYTQSQVLDRSNILEAAPDIETPNEMSEFMQQALTKLSKEEYEIFLRISLLGEKQNQLAKEKGVSPSSISKKYRRARRKLRYFVSKIKKE